MVKTGDLVNAMALTNTLSAQEVREMLLQAGFELPTVVKGKDFWSEVQQQLTEACRLRVDGWGLRELRS